MKYLPSRKVSEILGVHPNTLRNWANSGKIEHITSLHPQHQHQHQQALCQQNTKETTDAINKVY